MAKSKGLSSVQYILYIGQTNNLDQRLKKHFNKTDKSAKFIKDGSKFRLVYQESFCSRLEAMRREKQLLGRIKEDY